ncbi:hypothetical protein [Aquitalea sp.]|nr:hypothetical protein [Aquitalea sp.]
MKTQWKTVIALAIVAATFGAQANEAHHQDASAAVVNKKAAKPAVKKTPASKVMPSNKEMEMQMEKMNAVHAKMAAAKTPEERQAAMQEGMAVMKDSMGMMKQMHMEHCQDGMSNAGMMKGMKPGDGMPMKSMMQGDVRMMDMMMQMLDQQSSMMKMPMAQ